MAAALFIAAGSPGPSVAALVAPVLARGWRDVLPFAAAMLPNLVDLAGITLLAWLELVATMLVVLTVIDLGYILLAARTRRFLRSAPAMRFANRVSATVMGGAAAAIAAR